MFFFVRKILNSLFVEPLLESFPGRPIVLRSGPSLEAAATGQLAAGEVFTTAEVRDNILRLQAGQGESYKCYMKKEGGGTRYFFFWFLCLFFWLFWRRLLLVAYCLAKSGDEIVSTNDIKSVEVFQYQAAVFGSVSVPRFASHIPQGQRGFVVPEKGALGASIVEGRKLKVATVLLNPTAIEGAKGLGMCSIPWSWNKPMLLWMVDKFMLFRLSFFTRWLYSDGHRWFTKPPQNPRNPFHSMGSSPMAFARFGRHRRSPMAVAFEDCDWAGFGWLHLGRILGGDWDGHHEGEKSFEDFVLVSLLAIIMKYALYTLLYTHEFYQILCWGVEKGFWALTFAYSQMIWNLLSRRLPALQMKNSKGITFHEHAVHWSKEWWHLHQEGAWLPVTVQDSLEIWTVSQGSVS